MNALQAALVAQLRGHGGLAAKLTTYLGVAAVFDVAPQNAARPYVTVHRISGTPAYTLGPAAEEIEEGVYQVSIWTTGPSKQVAGEVFDQVRAALDEQVLTVTGWRHIRTRREQDVEMYDAQENVVHRAITYRVTLEK